MSIKSNLLKSFAIAATVFAAPSLAYAGETSSFVHAGTTYTYTQTERAGQRVISGNSSDGKAFRLIVSRNKVTGTFNNAPVTFSLREVKTASIAMR